MQFDMPVDIKTVYEKATCLYTLPEIEEALDKVALEIHATLSESNPLLLCVMLGGLIPAGNLLPRLDFPLELDYLHTARYRGETRGGELNWLAKPRVSLKGRNVLILDDILDAGLTLASIVNYCESEGARQVYTAVLLDKQRARLDGGLAKADFAAITMEEGFVFGYGMDYRGYLRNAPGIYVVAPEHQ